VEFGTGGPHRKLLCVRFTLVRVGLLKAYSTLKKVKFC